MRQLLKAVIYRSSADGFVSVARDFTVAPRSDDQLRASHHDRLRDRRFIWRRPV